MIFYKLILFKTIWLVTKSIFYLLEFGFKLSIHIMRNCVRRNHTTLQLKLKKQLIYNYYATIV
jgi:hypothetical protein